MILICESLFPSDANECEMFGPEICKNGHCSNRSPGYTCFCRSGFFYDNIRLECVGKCLYFGTFESIIIIIKKKKMSGPSLVFFKVNFSLKVG